jgi:hypothetical protein
LAAVLLSGAKVPPEAAICTRPLRLWRLLRHRDNKIVVDLLIEVVDIGGVDQGTLIEIMEMRHKAAVARDVRPWSSDSVDRRPGERKIVSCSRPHD